MVCWQIFAQTYFVFFPFLARLELLGHEIKKDHHWYKPYGRPSIRLRGNLLDDAGRAYPNDILNIWFLETRLLHVRHSMEDRAALVQ